MKITHTLIVKFLENRCNAEEAAAVARRLKQHPELMDIYLRSSWEAAGTETVLPPGYPAAMLEVIEQQIAKEKRRVHFRWFAAAASFLALLGAWWILKEDKQALQKPVAAAVKEAPDAAQWKGYTNHTAKTHTLKLADGSLVQLAPRAAIRYPQPFDAGKRTIYLEGEADFEVAHDRARPFTVHTKLLATTALGTSFRVSQSVAGCQVRLFTGKVQVRALDNNLKGWQQDIVLLPGQQLKYSPAKGAVVIDQVGDKHQPSASAKDRSGATTEENKLVFDNTPLAEVMKALARKYQVPIGFDEKQLEGKYFSGEVLKDDPLSVILNVIAHLNGLQVAPENDGYRITRSQ